MPVTRGRISAGAQAIAVVGDKIQTLTRPDSPYDLTDEESVEWWAVVNAMEPGWFRRETHGLLTQYCRLVVRARRVAQLLTQMEGGKKLDLREYRGLLRTEGDLSQGIAHLATKMRLSQQSSYDRTKRKPDMAFEKPWEDNQPDDETNDAA